MIIRRLCHYLKEDENLPFREKRHFYAFIILIIFIAISMHADAQTVRESELNRQKTNNHHDKLNLRKHIDFVVDYSEGLGNLSYGHPSAAEIS